MNLDRKYRSKTFENVVGLQNIIRDLKAYLKTGDPPHLMFVGPPGVGKTTLGYIFASMYLGEEIDLDTEDTATDYKEYNCSAVGGIDTARDDIAEFSNECAENGKKRVIYLKEVDNSTKQFQMALKDIIEKNEDKCIFILDMNERDGIKVQALVSRCADFTFKRAKDEELASWFSEIASLEDVVFEDNSLVMDIVKHYKGDCRAMLVDCLEALRGYDSKSITKEDLYKIYEEDTQSLANIVFNDRDPKKRFFEIWRKENFNVRRFIEDYQELNGHKKPRIAAIVDANLRAGGSEKIQMAWYFDEMSN